MQKLGKALSALSTLKRGGVYPVVSNPKAPNSKSHARFALYTPGISVGAYVAACVASGQSSAKRNAKADIAWDKARGFINIAP